MDREPIILGIIGIIVLIVTFGVLTLSGEKSSTSNNQCNLTDEQFIEQMVPHHEQAIAMTQVAQQKAEHPEIKQLAGNIINTQSSEVSKMRGWYKEWYGKDVPTNSSMMNSSMVNQSTESCDMDNNSMMSQNMTNSSMMQNTTDLESLKNTNPFDKAFLEQMIAHHEMAVMMAQGISNLEHQEIRELANSIIKTQSAEIELMKQWLNEWYGTNTPSNTTNSNSSQAASSNTVNVDHASHHQI